MICTMTPMKIHIFMNTIKKKIINLDININPLNIPTSILISSINYIFL